MRCEPEIETTTVTKGVTITLSLTEAKALFQIVGHIGGGVNSNGSGITAVRATVNALHSELAKIFDVMDCPDPFNREATVNSNGTPHLKGLPDA